MQRMQQNPNREEGTSLAAVWPNTRVLQQNPKPRGKTRAPDEVTSLVAAKPKGKNKKHMQKNANPNPRAKNPGPNQMPWPNQPNPHFRPNDGPWQHWHNITLCTKSRALPMSAQS